MKDLYTFDATPEEALECYGEVSKAYTRIFQRLGVPARMVEADSGQIGGDTSHEFHILSDVGEDTLLHCSSCKYAANEERAVGKAVYSGEGGSVAPAEEVVLRSILDDLNLGVVDNLSVEVLQTTEDPQNPLIVAVCHGSRPINECLVKKHFGGAHMEVLNPGKRAALLGGGERSQLKLHVIIDTDVAAASGYSLKESSADLPSGVTAVDIVDVRTTKSGDKCTHDGCEGHLVDKKGIEVGHIFVLGQKYSKPLNCSFTNVNGKPEITHMGCYGLGISRILAGIVEASHDEAGIVWPMPVAPYRVVLVPHDKKKDTSNIDFAAELYQELQRHGNLHNQILVDDRNLSLGIKLTDAELIGIPMTVVIGRNRTANGLVEIKIRETGENIEVPSSDLSIIGSRLSEMVDAGLHPVDG